MVNGYKALSIELFKKVMVRSGKKLFFQDAIIDICLNNGEYDYPKKLLTQAVGDNPSNYDLVHRAGLVFYDTGDFDQALKYFRMVDSHKLNHLEAKLYLAKIYHMNNKVLKADDYLNQILRIDPQNSEALALRREL